MCLTLQTRTHCQTHSCLTIIIYVPNTSDSHPQPNSQVLEYHMCFIIADAWLSYLPNTSNLQVLDSYVPNTSSSQVLDSYVPNTSNSQVLDYRMCLAIQTRQCLTIMCLTIQTRRCLTRMCLFKKMFIQIIAHHLVSGWTTWTRVCEFIFVQPNICSVWKIYFKQNHNISFSRNKYSYTVIIIELFCSHTNRYNVIFVPGGTNLIVQILSHHRCVDILYTSILSK